jgi:uncharacterized RDD family membrane protein YckC
MTNDQLSEHRSIAGFWRRLGAFFIDCLLLGAIGLGIGFFLTQELVSLGPWGRLLGFVVAFTYFGILNSRLGGGQTLGKRVLNIKVVKRNGSQLSVTRSFLRFLLLGAPWFLNNAQLPDSVLLSFWFYILSITIFGIGLSIIYLFVFNRRTRQSLHDLLVGSYVVPSKVEGTLLTVAPWQFHLVVCGLLIVASGVTPYFAKNLAASEPFSSMMNIYRAVKAEPWVVHVQVNKGKTFVATLKKGQSETTYLNVMAYAKDPDLLNLERAKKLTMLALATDSSIRSLDVVQVTLAYGYDIGIASSWRSKSYAYSPEEWVGQ